MLVTCSYGLSHVVVTIPVGVGYPCRMCFINEETWA